MFKFRGQRKDNGEWVVINLCYLVIISYFCSAKQSHFAKNIIAAKADSIVNAGRKLQRL